MALLVVSCSSAHGQSGSPEVERSSGNVADFATIVSRSNDGDSIVFGTLEQIVRASDVVVSGRIMGVESGRSFLGERGQVLLRSAVISLEDVAALAGDGSLLEQDPVIEVYIHEDDLQSLKDLLPRGESAVFFVSDYTKNGNSMLHQVSGRTYLFPFQQGFLMDGVDGVVSVMGGIVSPAGFKNLDSISHAVRTSEYSLGK
jgi:hypothetical protein